MPSQSSSFILTLSGFNPQCNFNSSCLFIATSKPITEYEGWMQFRPVLVDCYEDLIFHLQEMTSEEKSTLCSLSKCDFTHMSQYFKAQTEARKQMTKDKKQVSCLNVSFKPFKMKTKVLICMSTICTVCSQSAK